MGARTGRFLFLAAGSLAFLLAAATIVHTRQEATFSSVAPTTRLPVGSREQLFGSLRRVDLRQLPGARGALRIVERSEEFEQRAAFQGGDTRASTGQRVNALKRDPPAGSSAGLVQIFDLPSATTLRL